MIIDWIKRFFVTEKKVKSPKCDICGLGAKFHMLVEFQTMELVEIENEPGKETLPVETYPTFMIRVNDKMVDTITGYSGKHQIETKLNSY